MAGCGQSAPAPGTPDPSSAPAAAGSLPASVTKVLPTAYERLARSADSLDPTKGYPRSVDGGKSSWTTKPVDDWTSGFFPGELWLARDLTGDQAWTARAQRWTAPIASQIHRTDTHDLGFVVDDSFGEQVQATGQGADDVVTAARSLATRYSPKVHAIKSWDTDGEDDKRGSWRFPVIIDTAMNLELLDHASTLPGGDPAWKDIATQHALTASHTNMRPDGSIAHVAVFDPDTGAFLKRDTWQGAAPDSTWSRGQGWAIHGFAAQARAANNPELKAAAQKAADWWLAHTSPGNRVPPWDFSKPTEERDTSAAAVAASGLLDLADQVGGADGARYRQAAAETLDELATKEVAPSGPALLAHATGGKPQDSEVDVGLVYGDYYFLEAARRWTVPAAT
ncbi:glycoside hydrolase family 88 protein [Actinomycetospora endophytica]|uniref:Glycoside hydrolase family 88 protein n=1 Tax=Actinomycetospora endophytica TaxID=2291215 RepID=A0ABS8P3K1_9PSEU|nr:glycoside hydrolase family 88 protein [Actinomycetospora endophytica]MCD2192813.1 glycoside hydrolase family 88 protein [Actinomycetospora endophytica]